MIPLMQKRTFLLKWALSYAIVTLVLAWQFREDISGAKLDYLSAAFVSSLELWQSSLWPGHTPRKPCRLRGILISLQSCSTGGIYLREICTNSTYNIWVIAKPSYRHQQVNRRLA